MEALLADCNVIKNACRPSEHFFKRLISVQREHGAREAVFDLFHKERHVDRPRVGEWVDLAGETRVRRKTAPSATVKRGATRIKRYKAEVTITHEEGRLIVELPENFDMTLVPEGNYRLEAQLAAIASFKLVERPGRVSGDETDADSPPETAESQEELVQVGE